MKPFSVPYILLVLLSLSPLPLASQDLPALKTAEEVQSGTFPNGVSYYIVTNSTSKGYANFALVQKGASDMDRVRGSLSSLPSFPKMPPYAFEASKGVGYTREGYVKYTGGSSVFSFEDVPAFDSAALDSTIILIFDMVRGYDGDQAVVVSGDVDAARLKDRFYLLSLTVGQRGDAGRTPVYEWKPSSRIKMVHNLSSTGKLSCIKASYASARLPREYMSSPRPLVSSMFASELGSILRKRTQAAFAAAGIPLADMKYEYRNSSMSDSDEVYSFGIYVDERDIDDATSLFAGVLSDLDSNGASAAEFGNAKAEFLAEADKASGAGLSNREYVDACVASYLYGAAILAKSASYNFFKDRKLPQERDVALFNRFVSALLDPARNLTLSYETPSLDLDVTRLEATFKRAWEKPAPWTVSGLRLGDTLVLAYAGRDKVRISAETPDPVTGGRLWTFSNGMKVLFRKTSDSRVHYSWLIRGGYAEVPGINPGESAFVEDMLGLCKVAGLSPSDYRNLLEMNGISMRCKVSLTDMRIEGSATSGKMELLLRSLLSLVHKREVSMPEFEYYRRCEALRQEAVRLSEEGIYAVMDSVMCPDFRYPLTKNMDRLSPDLPLKADRYFSSQFRKGSDGVLYIDGDIDEAALKKLLCRYLGTFYTGNRYSVRPKVPYQMRSGWSTYTVDRELSYVGDGSSSTSMAVAVERPFSMKAWCTFRIAVEALRRQLVVELAPLGQYVEIQTQIRLFPSERLAVFMNVRPCEPGGLPMDVEPADPFTTLGAVRDALTAVSIRGVSPSDLAGFKASLAHEMESELADPVHMMHCYLRRFSEGKDMVTNYKGYLASVSVQDVADLLRDFENAGKVEYIIK